MILQLHHHKIFVGRKTIFLGVNFVYFEAETEYVLVKKHHKYQIYLGVYIDLTKTVLCRFYLAVTVLSHFSLFQIALVELNPSHKQVFI